MDPVRSHIWQEKIETGKESQTEVDREQAGVLEVLAWLKNHMLENDQENPTDKGDAWSY